MDRLTRFAWSVLAYNLLVIVWGAFVRASGSGAGCGSHWPLCNGEVVPRAAATATLIEFSHRLTSGLALLAVVALLAWVWRARRAGDPARAAAVASAVFMAGEALVGAGLVLFQLVADNASMARALFMATHLVNTFFLLASLTLTAHFAGLRAQVAAAAGRGPGRPALAWAAAGMLLTGVSGAVAALGDTLYPAVSLGHALEQELSPTAHLLIRLRLVHPFVSLAVSAGLVWLALRALPPRGRPRDASVHTAGPAARAVLALACAQVACGALNVLLLAPIAMQLLHLLLAELLWIAFVLMSAELLAARPQPPLPRAA